MKAKPRANKKTAGKGKQGGATRFAKGHAGGPGRPKGSKNTVTKDGREFWRTLLERPKFLSYLERQFDRKNGPGVPLIQLASYYAFGKPVQAIDLGVTFDPGEHLARMYDKVVGPSK